MIYKIDIKRIIDGNVQVQGWVLPENLSEEVRFIVLDSDKNEINFELTRVKRDDVSEIYLKEIVDNTYFGFDINFPFGKSGDSVFYLLIVSGKYRIKEKISKSIIDSFNTVNRKKKELVLAYFNKNTFKRAFEFLCKEGIIEFIKKTKRKIKGLKVDYDYSEWYELTKISDEELDSERSFSDFKFTPKISIVIPVYDTEEKYLYLLFKSIFAQTYRNFEICIADATDYTKAKNNPRKFFDKLIDKKVDFDYFDFDFKNFHVKYLDKNLGIADNTNEAIKLSTGDYVALCDHDDSLTLDALFEVVKALNTDKNIELLYSDEDKVDVNDGSYFEPSFKPDFNLDMLLSVNYFCHLTVIKKTLLDELYELDGAYERSTMDGAQDYDLFLRLVSFIINKTYSHGTYDVSSIYHIKKVLYHWRCHKKSTSKNVESKIYAFTNGAKAVGHFYNITKINFPKVEKVEKGFDYGIYHTIFSKDYDEPLISVIIPNKDHIEDLDKAINSLSSGTYKNLEFIICENNSTDSRTFDYYDKISKKSNIQVVKYDGEFNYSRINNYASKFAKGDYYLFANNDIEMISSDSIHEMLSYLKRDDVGIVGAKLLYFDNTYQHAGVVIGIGGIADHLFKNINCHDHTYMNRAEIVSDYNAVTAACLMIKKSVFNDVNGFDEKIAVAFNDIDLCMRVRELGYLIVYNPYSSFYHYESKSRGLEDTKEKIDRFNKEFAFFVKRWSDRLSRIDEYYNPNLTLRQNNFALRNLKYEKIGEPFPIPREIKEIMKGINE